LETYLLYESLLQNWSKAQADGVFSDLKGKWSLAGELDSPIPQERLDEVRARPLLGIDAALDRQCSDGGLLVVVDTKREGLAESLIVRRAEKYLEDKSFLPIWLRCWEFDLSDDPRTILEHYFSRITSVKPSGFEKSRKLIILERPELAKYKTKSIDGPQARDVLRSLKSIFEGDQVIVIVGQESFIARHPYPGFYCISFKEASQDVDAPRSCGSLQFFPPSSVPQDTLNEFMEELARCTSPLDPNAFFQTYRLLSTQLKGWPVDKNFFTQSQINALIPKSDIFTAWLRRFIEHELDEYSHCQDARLRSTRSYHKDALVSARLYVLIDNLSFGDAPKQTFSKCDLASWLCFLRSLSYECVAVVASRLQREALSGSNLVHAPSLEFANLKGADLSGSDLYRVNLSYADLRGASLVKADLSRSHLKGADLKGADLRDADLSYSSLELVDLREANLDGANLHGCITDYAMGL